METTTTTTMTTTPTTNPLTLGRRMRPTKRHRPAIWECMLGTVYAMNDEGVTRYFDYRWDEATEFAGVTPDRGPRTARKTERVRYTNDATTEPRNRQMVLWITKEIN